MIQIIYYSYTQVYSQRMVPSVIKEGSTDMQPKDTKDSVDLAAVVEETNRSILHRRPSNCFALKKIYMEIFSVKCTVTHGF